jgi:broad specificity phosphatase PhoE
MPPTLVLIRHAEAEHNATGMILRSSNKNIDSELYLENWDLLDPLLTERGIEQSRLLQDHLRKQTVAKNIEYIVTSPLRRTLQTTLVGLDWLIEQGVGVEVDAMWQGRP